MAKIINKFILYFNYKIIKIDFYSLIKIIIIKNSNIFNNNNIIIFCILLLLFFFIKNS